MITADGIVRVRREGRFSWHWRKDVDGPRGVVILEGFNLTRWGARRAGRRAYWVEAR